jgi:hypothetical protein
LDNEDVMQALNVALVVALISMSVPPAGAQTAAVGGSKPTEFQSTFHDYRPFKDQPPASWRAVNDQVARVGGHAGALKAEDSPPAKAGEQRPAAPTTSAPGGAAAPSHPAHH